MSEKRGEKVSRGDFIGLFLGFEFGIAAHFT
jgi:hypothetical protein